MKFSGRIYETDMYTVEIRHEPEGKYEVYGIVNKKYGVVEAYISALPRAIQMCDQLEYDLKHGHGQSDINKATEFLKSLGDEEQGSALDSFKKSKTKAN